MAPPKKNKNAEKPSALKRIAKPIYIRPTALERQEIEEWAGRRKLASACLEVILDKVRSEKVDEP